MLYTIEGTRRRINKMGRDGFTKCLLEANLSDEDKNQLENLHIISDGIVCLSAINLLAQ